MKLVTFEGADGSRIGVLSPDTKQVIDLAKAFGHMYGAPYTGFLDMLALMHAGERGLDMAGAQSSRAPGCRSHVSRVLGSPASAAASANAIARLLGF